MKLRNIKNLPIFLESSAQQLGRVEKAVMGDDYQVSYLVVIMDNGTQGMVYKDDFTLGKEAVIIWNEKSIKSRTHGEELTIYEKKLGDRVFNHDGKELGVVSDFVVNRHEKTAWGIEVSSGVIVDMLDGRQEIPLNNIRWASTQSGVAKSEGGDIT